MVEKAVQEAYEAAREQAEREGKVVGWTPEHGFQSITEEQARTEYGETKPDPGTSRGDVDRAVEKAKQEGTVVAWTPEKGVETITKEEAITRFPVEDVSKKDTAQELMHGKVENGKFTPSPYGIKGKLYVPYPDWVKTKIVRAQNKAFSELEPYLVPGITKDEVSDMLGKGQAKKDIVKAAASIGKEVIDLSAAIQAGKTKDLETIGVKTETIKAGREFLKNQRELAIVESIKGKSITEKQRVLFAGEFTARPDLAMSTGAGQTAADMALYMLPVIGTVKLYNDLKKDGWTGGDIAWFAASIAGDILFFTMAGAAAGASARAAIGLTRTARVAAATRGAGRFVLADIKAPYTMVRHPLDTAKGILKLGETLVRPAKIPLAAAEVSYTTVRLPVKAFASTDEAMTVRDIATLAAIKEGKFAAKIGDVDVKLPPSVMQRLSDGMAVHATPDITPFLEGMRVTRSREGGVFFSPNFHSRFALASAFGDMPEGGVKGMVVVRDDALLKAMGGSGKIYNKQVEIEALLKAGINLPPPSQVLFTRGAKADVSSMIKEAKALRLEGKLDDALALEKKATALKKSGDKVAIAVIGKPFTKAEVANLKLYGALDTIRQLYTPPAIISAKGIAQYEKLNEIRREASTLVKQAGKLKAVGKLDDARIVERQADELIERAIRLARQYTTSPAAFGGNARLLYASLDGRTPISELSRIAVPERYRRVGAVRERAYARVDLSRVNPRDLARDSRELLRSRERVRLPERRVEPPRRVRPPERPPRRAPPPERPPERPPRRPPPPERPPERPPKRPPPPERPPERPPKRPPPPPVFSRGQSDKKKHEVIAKSPGAVAWYSGKLSDDTIIHVIIHPWRGPSSITTLKGKIPTGFKVRTGPGSAKDSVVLLYGEEPPREVMVDVGIVDAHVNPAGKGVKLTFTADPKQLTTGDMTTAKRVPAISRRERRLSPRVPSLR